MSNEATLKTCDAEKIGHHTQLNDPSNYLQRLETRFFPRIAMRADRANTSPALVMVGFRDSER